MDGEGELGSRGADKATDTGRMREDERLAEQEVA